MDSRSRASQWRVPADQQLLLRQVLRLAGANDGVNQVQRTLIRELCTSPHLRALAPEQFVISMKEMLNTAANDARLPLGRERDDLLFRLLTVSIEEFFQVGANSDGDGLPEDPRRAYLG